MQNLMRWNLSLIEISRECKEKLLYSGVLIVLLLFTLFLYEKKVEPFETFSLGFNDRIFDTQKKIPNQDIVFVAVDERSVNEYGRWPWDREKLAKGIDKLIKADVVLMDMIFSEPTTDQRDEILGESLAGLNSSVCGFFLRNNSTQSISDDAMEVLSDSSLDLLQSQIDQYSTPKFTSSEYAEMNIVSIMESCTLSGSFTTIPDSDGKLRAYPIAMYFEDMLYPSLAIQGLRLKYDKPITRVDNKHLELKDREIGLNEKSLIRLNFYNYEDYNVISFIDLVEGNNGLTPSYFKDKMVVLGITEVGAGDIVNTPIGLIPGPLLHYTFLSNFFENHLIKEPPYITSILIAFMVIVPFILLFIIKKIFFRAVLNIFIYITLYIVIRYLFISEMIFIDLFYPLLSLLISFLVFEAIAFNLQEQRGKFMRGAFSSYLSSDLLDQLIENPDALALGGENKELSILFSDIRGFTSLSESMDPVSLINLLNRYFTPMTNAVLENNGMLDKYIGDAVMAFFNAPIDIKNHADASCTTALEMIERLDSLNIELEKESIEPIKIGIGINTAEVVVGNMGSDTRFNYTVIGDGVNLASRVEGLTKNYGIEILITEFTVKKLHSDFVYREIEPVKVQGKDKAVLLYQLMPNTEQSIFVKEAYDKALMIYKSGDLESAEKQFTLLIEKYDDKPSKYFLKDIQNKHPWGVHKMTTK
ncbi:MAG: adenylate/guanylate cyclase domain-containing protein [Campylobacterota bacterium]|nr:adenylate/guanylate cyclase domain-containing protein [Campylobacterota bacterium]